MLCRRKSALEEGGCFTGGRVHYRREGALQEAGEDALQEAGCFAGSRVL